LKRDKQGPRFGERIAAPLRRSLDSLSQEWLGPAVQTVRKLGIVVFQLYFVAHQGTAGGLVILE
jgi:hypothetical protein